MDLCDISCCGYERSNHNSFEGEIAAKEFLREIPRKDDYSEAEALGVSYLQTEKVEMR